MTAAAALAVPATRRPIRRAWRLALLAAVAVGLLVAPFLASPVPGARLLRLQFDAGGQRTAEGLASHVPPGVVERQDLSYDPGDPDARYDLYLPPAGVDGPAITIVWLHGGGWISGSRADAANYARILAGRGVAVVALDYSLAPEHRYPTPVRQVNRALGHLAATLANEGLDPARIVLAGSSSGAQIAAQVAALTRSPEYARRLGIEPALPPASLRSVLLFCGRYGLQSAPGLDWAGLRTRLILWAYSGKREPWLDPGFAEASILDRLVPDFPPAFVSAGNADGLLPHSRALAQRLEGLGNEVETLFFADDRQPALRHEYQFDLDDEAGRLALARAMAFVRRHAGR